VARREPSPEFFIDRSLGSRHLAEALRVRGQIVHTLSSVYGEQVGQSIVDERWLGDRVPTGGSCS
jgi:hypothetical protein